MVEQQALALASNKMEVAGRQFEAPADEQQEAELQAGELIVARGHKRPLESDQEEEEEEMEEMDEEEEEEDEEEEEENDEMEEEEEKEEDDEQNEDEENELGRRPAGRKGEIVGHHERVAAGGRAKLAHRPAGSRASRRRKRKQRLQSDTFGPNRIQANRPPQDQQQQQQQQPDSFHLNNNHFSLINNNNNNLQGNDSNNNEPSKQHKLIVQPQQQQQQQEQLGLRTNNSSSPSLLGRPVKAAGHLAIIDQLASLQRQLGALDERHRRQAERLDSIQASLARICEFAPALNAALQAHSNLQQQQQPALLANQQQQQQQQRVGQAAGRLLLANGGLSHSSHSSMSDDDQDQEQDRRDGRAPESGPREEEIGRAHV